MIRMSAMMFDDQDTQFLILNSIIDSVRKTSQQNAPQVAPDRGPSQRVLFNHLDRGFKGTQEAIGKLGRTVSIERLTFGWRSENGDRHPAREALPSDLTRK